MEKTELRARGTQVMLEHGGLPEVLNPYLIERIMDTGGELSPLWPQFIANPDQEQDGFEGVVSDTLIEDEHEIPGAPGLVYKYEAGEDEYGEYPGRGLWTITRNCAAYCRYCTRGRLVGIPANLEGPLKGTLSHTPHLSKDQIDQTLEYLKNNDGINEVILSGGDPLTLKPEVLKYVLYHLGNMQREGSLDIVRIGTRVPIHNPRMLKPHHYEALSYLRYPRLMIHTNHVLELSDEALAALHQMQEASKGIIMTQSVLLKGVNDNPKVLRDLFNLAAKEGFVPYYVYQNDPVYWAKHFTVPFEEALAIWGKVRPVLSGVAATARLVIDTPYGYGKIPLPEGDSWVIDYGRGFKDFKGTIHHPDNP